MAHQRHCCAISIVCRQSNAKLITDSPRRRGQRKRTGGGLNRRRCALRDTMRSACRRDQLCNAIRLMGKLTGSLAWCEGCKSSKISFRPRKRVGSDFRCFETKRAKSFAQLDSACDPVDDGKPVPFRKTRGQVSHAGTPENDHFGSVLMLRELDFRADLCGCI